jgi:hypothetical protein
LGDIAGLGENGLRALVGKPQVEPWGGSEHIGRKMQKAGLVSPDRRPKTELLASLVSPGAVLKTALNAPKTARNLLKALDNLDAPATMRNMAQRGAIDVWHGSPHKFDTFKAMDNIGGGEGAQAYGHGGYHASNKDVADRYAREISGRKLKDSIGYQSASDRNSTSSAIDYFMAMKRGEIPKDVVNGKPISEDEISRQITGLSQELAKHDESLGASPQIYRNQLRWPDPAREATDPLSDKHFLDWDKPLSEQSPEVQRALNSLSDSDFASMKKRTASKMADGTGDGNTAYNAFGGYNDPVGASNRLRDLGIPGIRYLDGGSRSAGQGSHNYVTFDDALVNILERNGQPAGNLSKLVAPQDEALRVAQQNAALPVEQGGLGLRVDNTPEERAAAMGFDVNRPDVHGSGSDFQSFDAEKIGDTDGAGDWGDGFYFAGQETPRQANHFAEMGANPVNYPVYLNRGKVASNRTLDSKKYEQMADGYFNTPEDALAEMGYDSIRYKHKGIGDIESVVFDPSRIRSRFAAFDPMRKDSSDLLAGSAPIGLGALISQPKEKKKKKQP